MRVFHRGGQLIKRFLLLIPLSLKHFLLKLRLFKLRPQAIKFLLIFRGARIAVSTVFLKKITGRILKLFQGLRGVAYLADFHVQLGNFFFDFGVFSLMFQKNPLGLAVLFLKLFKFFRVDFLFRGGKFGLGLLELKLDEFSLPGLPLPRVIGIDHPGERRGQHHADNSEPYGSLGNAVKGGLFFGRHG